MQYIFGIRTLSCYCHHQLLLQTSTFNDHNVRQLSLFATVLWNSSSLKTRFCIIDLRLLTPTIDCIHVRRTLVTTVILFGIDDDANVNAIINGLYWWTCTLLWEYCLCWYTVTYLLKRYISLAHYITIASLVMHLLMNHYYSSHTTCCCFCSSIWSLLFL